MAITKFSLALLICSVWILPLISQGQTDSPTETTRKLTALYLELDAGRTTQGVYGGVGINVIFPSRWGGSVSYARYHQKAEDTPTGYRPGTIFGLKLSGPEDEIIAFAVRAIRTFPIDQKLRIGAEVGFSYGQHTTFIFTPRASSPGNYDISERKEQIPGISMKVNMDILFSRFAGLGGALVADINRLNPLFGLDLHIMLGLTRDRVTPVRSH